MIGFTERKHPINSYYHPYRTGQGQFDGYIYGTEALEQYESHDILLQDDYSKQKMFQEFFSQVVNP